MGISSILTKCRYAAAWLIAIWAVLAVAEDKLVPSEPSRLLEGVEIARSELRSNNLVEVREALGADERGWATQALRAPAGEATSPGDGRVQDADLRAWANESARPDPSAGPFPVTFVDWKTPPKGTGVDTVEEIQNVLANTTALALGREIVVTSAYRADSKAHARGSIDIEARGDRDARLGDARRISRAVQQHLGDDVLVILEEVYVHQSKASQVNTYFRYGNVYRVLSGPRKSDPELHATGTHIHVQANNGFRIPAPFRARGFDQTLMQSGGPAVAPLPLWLNLRTRWRGKLVVPASSAPGLGESVYFGDLGKQPNGRDAFTRVLRDGEGEETFPDGSTFKGVFDRDAPKYGRRTLSNGTYYDGDWRRGADGVSRANGKGTLSVANGAYLEGTFVDGRIRSGKAIWAGGGSFDGLWSADELPDQGTATALDGSTYTGTFRAGVLEGPGRVTTVDGTDLTGQFKNGLATGPCSARFRGGATFEGQYVDGRAVRGKYTKPDGSFMEGEFTDGAVTGRGKVIYGDGTIYEGELKEGVPHGQGSARMADGRRFDGEFRNGVSQSNDRAAANRDLGSGHVDRLGAIGNFNGARDTWSINGVSTGRPGMDIVAR